MIDDGFGEVVSFFDDQSLEGDEDSQPLLLFGREKAFEVDQDGGTKRVETVWRRCEGRVGKRKEYEEMAKKKEKGEGTKEKERTGRCRWCRTESRQAFSVGKIEEESDITPLDDEGPNKGM